MTTKGQYIVGVSFNPSGRPEVNQIKTLAAALIDAIDQIPRDYSLLEDEGEAERIMEVQTLVTGATEHVRLASMLAVAAITKPPKE